MRIASIKAVDRVKNLSWSKLSRIDAWLVAVWGLVLLYAVVFSTLSLIRHASFNTHAFDLGLMQHIVWNTYVGEFFQTTYTSGLYPNLTSYLGIHVRLILLPISWLYVFHDGLETLLVLQSLVISSGAISIFLLGRQKLQSAFAAFVFAGLFLLHLVIQVVNLFDFHLILLAAAFLLWVVYFVENERYLAMTVVILLVMGCKENVVLVVVLLGVYLLMRRRFWPGAYLIVLGGGWFLVSFFIILPVFSSGEGSAFFGRYSYLGSSIDEMIVNLLTKSHLTWDRLIEPLSITYLRNLFLFLGMLSFLVFLVLLIAASEFGLSLFSSFEVQRTIDFQYFAIIISISVLAVVYGVGWLAG